MSLEILDTIRRRAIANPRRIALADCKDDRMLRAAAEAAAAGIAKIVLVGELEPIVETASANSISLTGMELCSISSDPRLAELAEAYRQAHPARALSFSEATQLLAKSDLLFAAMLARKGYVEGVLGGSLSTTGDVIRAALRGIGIDHSVSILSSLFLLGFPPIPGFREAESVIAFGDCAVVPDPSAEQLADIAISTAKSFHSLTGIHPRVAMLSFSSKGSAETESTLKVIEATRLARQRDPHLLIDGELQFDAAFVPEVGSRKAAGSPVAGKANVFIFPDLNSGNIGYKIAERLGMGEAIGPILQGLSKPMNDLSRGARVSDIVNMIAITGLQGQ